ncbi:hypothetical protein DL93DRAFT_2072824 [Clavulina sp. PMI_390]|nr:hypothetical protein DL93DRAFT_2072824 [Clavulina sp. PMI_390]
MMRWMQPKAQQPAPSRARLFRMQRTPESNCYINLFRWSEISGKVIMETVDNNEGVARISLYEFC